MGQSCETGSFRTVWSNCIQYTYVQTPKLFLFSILSRFWNRREKDGALMVFSQKDTRSPTFDPLKSVKENPLLIRFQSDQKFTFDPVRTNKSGPKMSFRTIHWHVIDKLFENSILIHLH